MKTNMSNTDRIIRTSIAVVLIALAWRGDTGSMSIVAYVAAAVFLLTSAVSFCPLYTLLGISTCSTSKS